MLDRTAALLADLRAESGDLDRLVAALPAARWRAATPAEGWSVAHQVAHLAWADRMALLAVTDPDAFARRAEAAAAAPESYVDEGAEAGAALRPDDLLERWRTGRERLWGALGRVPPGERIPWFGPGMSAPALATARLMETWAHGEDVAAALGVRREPTDRLRHVAWLGVRTRDHAYLLHGLRPPAPFRVELTSPGGEVWSYGPQDAQQRVTGSALHFCLLVTRRAHPADLDLRAEGEDAADWLGIAQAFAGPPGSGREPRAFTEQRPGGRR